MHVLAGAVGVSALIMASATAFSILKLSGGLYLIYLGVQTWRSAGELLVRQHSGQHGELGGSALPALRQGIIVEGTNPKTAAFFLALIPQFIPRRRRLAARAVAARRHGHGVVRTWGNRKRRKALRICRRSCQAAW